MVLIALSSSRRWSGRGPATVGVVGAVVERQLRSVVLGPKSDDVEDEGVPGEVG